MNIDNVFNKPKIIGVVADVNQGKSMLLYHLLETLSQKHTFNLFTYGLRLKVQGATQIYSVAEMESITNSIIVVDELSSLFDLDNRKTKKLVENTLRLINHNNNILVLCGTPENFKKFISGKLDCVFYKKTSKADLINGSRVKTIIESYMGHENGSAIVNISIDKALYYDGHHYIMTTIPYYKKYDTKKENVEILSKKMCGKGAKK